MSAPTESGKDPSAPGATAESPINARAQVSPVCPWLTVWGSVHLFTWSEIQAQSLSPQWSQAFPVKVMYPESENVLNGPVP